VLLHAATSSCAAVETSSAELHDGGRSGATTLDSSTRAVSTPASVPKTSESSSSSGSGSAEPELDLLLELCAHFLGRSRSVGGASCAKYRRDNGRAWVERLLRSEETFKKRIRMSIACFEHLYARVRPFFYRAGDGMVRRPPTIPPRVRLLVFLFWLAHGGAQFVACEVSDLAESTFCAILREVFAAIIKGFPPIVWPISLASQLESAEDFASRQECRIAGVVGVIYGTLIRVQTPPADWKTANNTRKCFHGVLLLGFVDARKPCIWIRSGLPGSLGDSRAFKESAWYERQQPVGCRVPHPGHVFLSDGGFASEYWLLKPYPQHQLTTMRQFFNYCISSPRAVVENSFGLLKGRWRVLHDKVSAETEFVPVIVESCALLHNFLIDEEDEWADAVDANDGEPRNVHPDVGVTRAYQMALHLRDELVGHRWAEHHESVGIQARMRPSRDGRLQMCMFACLKNKRAPFQSCETNEEFPLASTQWCTPCTSLQDWA